MLTTHPRELLPDPTPGVKLFLLLRLAPRFLPPRMPPRARQILMLVCRVLEQALKLHGETTHLRTLAVKLVRVLLPTTPTPGIGRTRLPALLTQWHSGRLVDLVEVHRVVREMFRTVPVFSPFPPGALLSLTTRLLRVCRLVVLTLTIPGVTILPMVPIVPRIFPLLQMDPLLL